MEPNSSTRVDMTRRYTLSDGTRVIVRSPGSVQIGTDEPRCVLVRDAPSETTRVLAGLDGAAPLAEVLLAQNADPLLWSALIEQLLAIELLVPVEQDHRQHSPVTTGAHLTDERSGIRHRHGRSATSRIMQAREDALVVVRGDSPLAAPIAMLLAASGVGHIHHQRGFTTSWAVPLRPSAPGSGPRNGDPAVGNLGGGDRGITAELRRSYPAVRAHPPAAHQHPTIVALTGDPLPDLGIAASLVRSQVPHLAVTAGVARSVVGPLVLPGRSSCLACAHRRRTDADPDWPMVARQLTGGRTRATAFLTSAAACLAVGQLLEHIDGAATPVTVNGTLEWSAGDTAPRRRSWHVHPDCGCHGPSGRR